MQNHYVSALNEEEEKNLINEFDEKLDVIEANTVLEEFYKIITNLRKQFPTLTSEEFKKFINDDEELKEELNELVTEFKSQFGAFDTNNKIMLDMLISMSTIGIEIPKNNNLDNKEDAF